MSLELLINVEEFETRVAMVSEGLLQEVQLARAGRASLTGNIYLGKVVRVIPGMQAAFVELGLDRPGFLHARDVAGSRRRDEVSQAEANGGRPQLPDIRKLLHEGQQVLVQINKDPISGKGARLTTDLAIASRFTVLMPLSEHLGVSQRIEEEQERERLRVVMQELRDSEELEMGFIARTAADGVLVEHLNADMRFLLRMWDRILRRRSEASAPALIYEELPLHIRMVRDLVSPDLTNVAIDHPPTYQRINEFVQEFLPEFEARLELHEGPSPLFERFSLEDEISRALDVKVGLKSGGSLVIEQTEAMITIDVNTGGFLGSHSLEETVFRTNLEAAQAIPRQLRLRNLGGIIVVDFIDMEDEEHQRQVLRALEKAAELETGRIRVEGFSGLGLVQMSRKRTRESLVQQMCEPCGHCNGVGWVKTAETTCVEILRSVHQHARDSGARRNGAPCNDAGGGADKEGVEYLIRANDAVVDRLLDEDSEQLAKLSNLIQRNVRIQVEPSYSAGQFDVVLMGAEH